jgi:uncharacterized protein (UPF0262 family)
MCGQLSAHRLSQSTGALPVDDTHTGQACPICAIQIAFQLVFDIRDTEETPLYKFILSLAPFKRIIKDYFDVCESYYAAIKIASLSQIETIDMGRRGLHNEGAQILHERMAGKVAMDFDTARRLFTLICALHMKG